MSPASISPLAERHVRSLDLMSPSHVRPIASVPSPVAIISSRHFSYRDVTAPNTMPCV